MPFVTPKHRRQQQLQLYSSIDFTVYTGHLHLISLTRTSWDIHRAWLVSNHAVFPLRFDADTKLFDWQLVAKTSLFLAAKVCVRSEWGVYPSLWRGFFSFWMGLFCGVGIESLSNTQHPRLLNRWRRFIASCAMSSMSLIKSTIQTRSHLPSIM